MLLACLVVVLIEGAVVTFWLIRALDPDATEEETEPLGAPIYVFPDPSRRLRRGG